jgi:hypothetical protein
LEKQPTTTTTTVIQKFLEASKIAGFVLDGKTAGILAAGLPPDWVDGPFSFPEYAAGQIKTDPKYRDKPPQELKRLFIAALAWSDLQESFPEWRAGEKRAEGRKAATETERRRIGAARKNKPKACRQCGSLLAAPDGLHGSCPSCGYDYFFNEGEGEWEFSEPRSLSAEYKRLVQGRRVREKESIE